MNRFNKKIFTVIERQLLYFDKAKRMALMMIFRGDTKINNIPDITHLAEGMRVSGIKYIGRDYQTKRLILRTQDGLYLSTDEYFWILYEVFCCKIYELDEKYLFNPFVVFDLGMNRAYSSLFFAKNKNCLKVFGYEPDVTTYEFALDNISLNPALSEKIETFNYGLASKNGTIDFFKIAGRDGISTTYPEKNNAIKKADRKNMEKSVVSLKKASEEFKRALSSMDEKVKVIVKIDVEGAEYDILEDLFNDPVCERIDMIVGDSHAGLQPIIDRLKPHKFILQYYSEANHCEGFMFLKA
jgi:FkbM family methyltransferase